MADPSSRAAHLLSSCHMEANGTDLVAGCLDGLRSFLSETFHPHLVGLSNELRACSRLLRDLVDHSRQRPSRVPVILEYLAVLLPSLRASLYTINKYYEDSSLTKEMRWRTMYHNMTTEAGGLPLPHRFFLYKQFLTLLTDMMIRSPSFDMNALEVFRDQILQLSDRQGIGRPQKFAAAPMGGLMSYYRDRASHWAEDIFSRPLPSRTPLPDLQESRAYGPWSPYRMPPQAKILFQRWFDNDRVQVMVYMPSAQDRTYYMGIRVTDPITGGVFFSMRSIRELCIGRDENCLEITRWSVSGQCKKLWAVLYFLTWEEMVLFHCTFVALKSEMTQSIGPQEYKLKSEKRLFQARIIDDGFKHSLIVYRDHATRGIRLHAAIWEGEMRRSPVWTAFITEQAGSASWLERQDANRIRLKNVQLYVFCSVYQPDNMRQNRAGLFEVDFATSVGADEFIRVFSPQTLPPPRMSIDSPPAVKAAVMPPPDSPGSDASHDHTTGESATDSGGPTDGGESTHSADTADTEGSAVSDRSRSALSDASEITELKPPEPAH